MHVTIALISAEETRPLRQRVLRPGLPAEHNIYPLDESGRDAHFGAFHGNTLVGTASIFNEPRPGEEEPHAWRLRGMTVLPHLQRRGLGRALLRAAIAYVRRQGGTLLWCNARIDAVPFYRKNGFESFGRALNLPDEGIHQRMQLFLERPTGRSPAHPGR